MTKIPLNTQPNILDDKDPLNYTVGHPRWQRSPGIHDL